VQQVLIFQGETSDIAFQNAQVFVSESSEGQAIASLLDLLLIVLLIFILVTHIEKREFHFTDIGLNLKRNTPLFMGLGLIIGGILFFGTAMLGILLNTIGFSLAPDFSQWQLISTLVASITFFVLNSFWQEILFRGYLQTLAVKEHGRLIGVIAVTVVFVIFHGLVQTLTPANIVTGILLFSFIGLLYDMTKSVYFVSMIHATLNFLPTLFNVWWQGLEAITVYGIALVSLSLLILYFEKRLPAVGLTR